MSPRKRRYRVDVTDQRTATFFVLAPDEDTARNDAEELVWDFWSDEWENNVDLDVRPLSSDVRLPKHAKVWSGGPDGEWK